MLDNKLEKEIQTYTEIAQQNKDVDVASLMLSALKTKETNYIPDKERRIAYLVSIAIPPFGLLFAIKFFFSDKDDGKQAAYICIGLTAAAFILIFFIMGSMFSGSDVKFEQIQQINPQDLDGLLQ